MTQTRKQYLCKNSLVQIECSMAPSTTMSIIFTKIKQNLIVESHLINLSKKLDKEWAN